MNEPVLNDKASQPDDDLLARTLDRSYAALQALRKHIRETYGETSEEWKFYGRKYGWQLKTFLKKRNLFFIIPEEGSFRVVFIFGDRAVAEIEKSDVDKRLKDEVASAKKYAEGRGLTVPVGDPSPLPDIRTLLKIKLEN